MPAMPSPFSVFKKAAATTAAATMALILTLSGNGCSPTPETAGSAPPAPGPLPDPHAPGMVWRVSGGKTAVFLAGSFHLLRATDYPLPEAYKTAWRETTHLVLEIPPGDSASPATQAALKPLVTLSTGTLQDHLTPPAWQELTAWSTRTATPLDTLQTQPPWMAALTITITATQRLGFRSDQGIEQHFTARLPGSGKTTEGLESVIGQLSLFAQLPTATQEAMLLQAITDTATLGDKATLLTKAWRAGDTPLLHATLTESFKDFPEIQKLLLDDRNAAWIPRLEAILQGDRPTMILVGSGHLCGPGSLIERLEAKGYRCVQIVPALPVPVKKAA